MHDSYESLRIRLEGSEEPVNWNDIPIDELNPMATMMRNGDAFSNAEGDIFPTGAWGGVPAPVIHAGLAALYELDCDFDNKDEIVARVYKAMKAAEE